MTERTLQRRCHRLGIACPKNLSALARVFAVARLLHWSKRPLSSVALALGFSNDANCYRLLRRILGSTLSRDMTTDDMDRVEEVILREIVGPRRVADGSLGAAIR
ncbi:MAG: helix-turn-helix domain-containing protein [Gemmatimonadota bacterium]|nr:helix-turn-helix domain-containing protein [Gemmatimonadota bacterium]